jgi:hypothetical protein
MGYANQQHMLSVKLCKIKAFAVVKDGVSFSTVHGRLCVVHCQFDVNKSNSIR